MKVVSFFSPSTGNGKTEFAINFGYTMAKEHGMKVLILEVDPYSPKLYSVYLQDNMFVSPEEWSNNYIFEGKNFDQLDADQLFLKPEEFNDLDLDIFFFPINPEFDPFRHAGEYTFGIDQIFLTRPWKLLAQIENWNYFDLVVLILPSRFSILSSSFFLVSDAIIVIAGYHNISSVIIENFSESIFSGIRVGVVITNAHLPLTFDDLVEKQIEVEKKCFLPVLMTVPRIKASVIPRRFRVLGDVGLEQLFSKITDKIYHLLVDERPQQLRASVTSRPLSLMVILSTGIPVFQHVFEERSQSSLQEKNESLLLGGSMIGIQTIIAKIAGTDEPIKEIDSGQIKLMIETYLISDSRSIHTILWTTASDKALRENLARFARLFAGRFNSLLQKRIISKNDFKTAYQILGDTFFADKPKMIRVELEKKIEKFAETRKLPVSEETFGMFVQEQVIRDFPDRNLLLAEFITTHNIRHEIMISHGIIPSEEEVIELERNLGATLCRCVFVRKELAPLDAITLLQLKSDEMKQIASLIIEKETISLKSICEILGIDESEALLGINGLIEGNYIRRTLGKENIFTID